jgi:hypothetical protein
MRFPYEPWPPLKIMDRNDLSAGSFHQRLNRRAIALAADSPDTPHVATEKIRRR